MKSITKILFLAFCFLAGNFCFSQEQSNGLPVTLEVVTGKVFADGAVQLQGNTTSLDNDPGLLSVEIKKPDNSIEVLKVRADKKTGNFLVKYYPKIVGKYKATAFSPDKLKSASAEFEVALNWNSKSEIENTKKELDKTVAAIESSISDISKDPALPNDDKTKIQEKWKKAKSGIDTYKTALSELQDGMDKIKKATDKYPKFGQEIRIQERAGEIYSELEDQTEKLKAIKDRMSNDKLKGEDVCGRLFALSEGCAMFSTMMNFKSTSIVAILKNIAIDKAWPEFYKTISHEKGVDEINFAVVQAGKAVASSEGKIASLKSADYGAGVAGDLTQFITDQVRKKICMEYTSPLSGEYSLQFKNNGKQYLYYKYQYAGKISLMAQKEKAGKEGANFSGYLEANINNVDFTDDIWAVEDKSQWREIYYRRLKMIVVPADLTKNDPGFGVMARQAMPGAFYFPIKGRIIEGKMVIELLPAMLELSATNANRTAIIVEDPNNEFNKRGVIFSYPTTTAWFMITRSMRMTDKNPKVVLDIKSVGGKNIIEGNFTRTETPQDTKVDFKLNFKMVNQ